MTAAENAAFFRGENGYHRETIEKPKHPINDFWKEYKSLPEKNVSLRQRFKDLQKDLETFLKEYEKMPNNIWEILQRASLMCESDCKKTREEHYEIIEAICEPWKKYFPDPQIDFSKEADHDHSGSEGSSSSR